MNESLIVFSLPETWVLLLVGVLWGLLIGALPGTGSSFAMVLILPFTFWMPMTAAIVILMATYTAAIYGGSISACLLNIPGTGGNIVTTFDGYPMTQQGKAGKALGGSALASFIGNFFAATLLILVGPLYAGYVLKFGPQEMFMVALWGFAVSILLSSGSNLKNLIAGFIGVTIATIGIDPVYGVPRLTFGSRYLLSGVPLLPAIIGVFGISVVLQNITEEKDLVTSVRQQVPKLSGFRELMEPWMWVVLLSSSLLGFIVGMIPGTGAIVACFIAYGIFKRVSKRRDEYGKGCYEGILVAESTNNAVHPGAVLTTIALGVPGSMELVILLGALTLHGLRGGPLLLAHNPEILYTIFLTFMLSGFLMVVIVGLSLRAWTKVIETPKAFLWPLVLFMCIVGTYSISSSIVDVFLMLAIGVLVWWGERRGFSKIPIIMGMVLGPIMENGMRIAIQLAPPHAFFTRPISAVILVMLVVTVGTFYRLLKVK